LRSLSCSLPRSVLWCRLRQLRGPPRLSSISGDVDRAHISSSSSKRATQSHTWLKSVSGSQCPGRTFTYTNQVQRQYKVLGIKYWANVGSKGSLSDTKAYGNVGNHRAVGHYNCSNSTTSHTFRSYATVTMSKLKSNETIVPGGKYSQDTILYCG
jgi:hypothetical protein